MIPDKKRQRALPGIAATLAAGFDLTTRHLWLLLLPVLLDAFLWLGPRLSVRPLIMQMLSLWPQDPALEGMVEQLMMLAPYTNLFTFLSIPLIGVPVLLVGLAPEKTPLAVSVTEVNSAATWFACLVLFLLLGLLLTAVYYTLIARAVAANTEQSGMAPEDAGAFSPAVTPIPLIVHVGRTGFFLFLVGVALVFLLLLLYVPLSLITVVVSLLSPLLGMLILLSGLVLVLWLVLLGFFLPQSVALYGHWPHHALRESVQIIRRHGSSAMGLILVVILVNRLLSQLLWWMEDGTWITAVSILAHAFISTSLLAATFIFYRDRTKLSYL